MRIYLAFMTLVLLVLALVFPLLSLGLLANPGAAGDSPVLSSGIEDIQVELKDWYAGGTADPEVKSRLEKLAGLVDRLDARQELAAWDRRRLAAGLTALGVAASLLASLVGVVLWMVTWRGIHRPVRQLEKDLSAMDSEKDFPFLAPRGLREIRGLHRAFNGLAGRLSDYRRRIQTAERQTMSRFIVHEVRNSLTPISLGLRNLESAASGGSSGRTVGLMKEALENLEGLLEQLKSLYTETPVTLQVLGLREVLAVLPSARDERVRPVLPDGLAVRADPVLLGLAVDNLLRNALQALDASGKPGTVELRRAGEKELAALKAVRAGIHVPADPAGNEADGNNAAGNSAGTVFLVVADDGPGIDVTARARMFDEYFTTKRKGMGLGLAFARKVLERQSGGLCLLPEDPLSGGASFIFWLQAAGEGDPA